MGPLVDLVGERDKEHERHEEDVAMVPGADLLWRPGHRGVHGVGQWSQGHQTVVAVCLHKVVSCDGYWVDVVLSEWPNECLQ